MKKMLSLVLAFTCLLGMVGCSQMQQDAVAGSTEAADIIVATDNVKWLVSPSIMVDGTLYCETDFPCEGVSADTPPDGEITSEVPEYETPTQNNQSNFGTGFNYWYGAEDGTVELLRNDKWYLFATNEALQRLILSESEAP